MKKFLSACIRKISHKLWGKVSLYPQGMPRGRALVSYVTEPFLLLPHQQLSYKHSNYWECKCIVDDLLERGYRVDVIAAQNSTWSPRPSVSYDVLIDIHSNIERLKPFVKKNGVIIHHIVTSEAQFQNAAENERIDALFKKTGIRLTPHRQLPKTNNIPFADAISGLGNETTFATYASVLRPDQHIFPIPGSSTVVFPYATRDLTKARKHLLWLGGGGAVHKGLDLVIDFVLNHSDFELSICGPVTAEKDFTELYKMALFENPRIHYHGRIDPSSDDFRHITLQAGIFIYPSCSEGQSGAVITALHAGLIPIVSVNSGVTLGDFGTTLSTCSTEEIESAVSSITRLSNNEFEAQSFRAWNYAQTHFTKNAFRSAYNQFLDYALLNKTNKAPIALSKSPLISVIIPTHNAGTTIVSAIDSIANQTYSNIEIIVVDDASSDNTEAIVNEHMKIVPNLSYYKITDTDRNRTGKYGRNINAGYSARNYGLSVCKGEWITFQDADDASLCNRIEIQLELARRFDSVHVCLDWIQFDEKLITMRFDFDQFNRDGHLTHMTGPDHLYTLARSTKGIAYKLFGSLCAFVPFSVKTLPIINKLFWGSLAAYPATGNSPLLKRSVIEVVHFRHRDKRVWPSFTGRGADRDFNYEVAETFKNSHCFAIPAYLWRSSGTNERTTRFESYIVK